MRRESTEGVLLLAHGTVETLEELPEFLLKIRHGRAPSLELIAETRRRYALIGGRSPLLDLTRTQADLLGQRLGCPVFVGMRLWNPSIEAALLAASTQRVERLYLLPLAPFSAGIYVSAAEQARARLASATDVKLPELVAVPPFATWPSFVEVHARQLSAALASQPADGSLAPETLIISAHSLPQVVIERGDAYVRELEAFVAALAQRIGRPLTLAYQSQGADGGAWLEPSLKTQLEAARGGRVLVSPAGFLTEHVETLYDLDIEARGWARELGIQWRRLPALNTTPAWIECMVELVTAARHSSVDAS